MNKVSESFIKSHLGLKNDLLGVIKEEINPHEVREKLRYSPRGFYHALSILGFTRCLMGGPTDDYTITELRNNLGKHGNSNINASIDMGLTLGEMKFLDGKDRQFYDQYIKGSGQNGYWIKKKIERDEREKQIEIEFLPHRRKLVDLLVKERIDKKMVLTNESSIQDKVEFYFNKHILTNNHSGRKANTQRLRKLLTRYFEAEANGEHPTLNDLALGAGYTLGATANYFLSQLGLKPLNNLRVKNNGNN